MSDLKKMLQQRKNKMDEVIDEMLEKYGAITFSFEYIIWQLEVIVIEKLIDELS